MFFVFPLNILGILTYSYCIQGIGGICSDAKKAECVSNWRHCKDELCGDCIFEVNGECFDPSKSDKKLVDCDPTTETTCKETFEDISRQLQQHLQQSKSADAENIDERSNVESRKKKDELRKDKDAHQIKPSSSNTQTQEKDGKTENYIPDVYFLIIIIACTLSGVAGIALSGYCWYRLHNTDDKVKNDYIPGVKHESLSRAPSNNYDSKLDYKAQVYHYAHTKNQIEAMERERAKCQPHYGSPCLSNDDDDEDDDDDVDVNTVYECPGLAPTGDMTVVNPLFSDQEVSISDEGRAHSVHSSPNSPPHSTYSPSR